ncbi:MAG: 2-octaprenyl-6-methoxyphenyl hydroxylase [Oleiphilus sp.]|nr:MAG: 2-octaprenyl-6-methoxyphenyl hydroxylase [Oleiphilus sp.]
MQRLNNKAPAKYYDAMVVGAGMVGASAALGLAEMGKRVLLIDVAEMAISDGPASSSFDDRATALSYGSRKILESMGIWDDLQAYVTPILDIHVSEQGRLGVTRLHAKDYQLDALGYVAPNRAIGKVLFSALKGADLDFLAPARVAAVRALPAGQLITIEGSEQYEVEVGLLVIADGARSQTAALAGIDYSSEPYRQVALIANVETYTPHENWAYERFTATGPMALLPLDVVKEGGGNPSQRRFSLVWTLPEEARESEMQLSEMQLLARLDHAFGGRMGGFERIGKLTHYPLNLIRAKEQFRPGVLLLGNAAHSLHPVAGQGFNLALRGLASALKAVRHGTAAGQLIGDVRVLASAHDQHATDQQLTIQASDQLVKQFGSSSSVWGIFRELGLVGLNNLPVAKRLFAEQAMGVAGTAHVFGDSHG